MKSKQVIFFLALAIIAPLGSASAQWTNVAASSSLPDGAGFADQYVADAGISHDAQVIFAEDFESEPALFIRFYVRFDKEIDFIHHFCTLRANKAVRGKDAWSGFGGAGLKPAGDERFSTALEPWGDVWFDNVVVARAYIGPAGK